MLVNTTHRYKNRSFKLFEYEFNNLWTGVLLTPGGGDGTGNAHKKSKLLGKGREMHVGAFVNVVCMESTKMDIHHHHVNFSQSR